MHRKIVVYQNDNNTNLINVFVYEDNKLVEVYEENAEDKRLEGNIYLGQVKDIAEGIQSAFIDIGQNKKAIIHIKDLIPKVSDVTGNEELDVRKYNIKDYVKPNQDIIVQIKRDNSNSNKGPKVTHDIKLIGSYIILMPYSKFTTVSKKIENEDERKRLIDITNKVLEENKVDCAAIIRTASENVEQSVLEEDIKKTIERWNEIQRVSKKSISPKLLYDGEGIIGKLLCDFSESDLEIVTNSKFMHNILGEKYPERTITLDANVLSKNSSEFSEKQKRKVWLKCGGYITIDSTEAMVTIDVNSGKFEGKLNLEENLFKVNKEAAEEIARQMRLKDLGGIIVIDFIDMVSQEDRLNIKKVMQEEVKKDRTKVQVMEFTRLGLLELTRKPIYGK